MRTLNDLLRRHRIGGQVVLTPGVLALGLDPENVMVCFKETTWENWSFGGGRLIHV